MKISTIKNIPDMRGNIEINVISVITDRVMQTIVTIALSKAFLLSLFILFCIFFRIFFKIKSILLCNLCNEF